MDYTGGNRDAVLREFIAEFKEHLQQLEPLIMRLEQEAGNTAVLNDIFRPVHSMKSASAVLGFTAINAYAHTLETLLDRLRKGMRAVDADIIDLLLACADVLRTFIDDVAHGGDGSAINAAATLESIKRLMEIKPEAPVAAEETENKENRDIFLAAAGQHLRAIVRSVDQMRNGNSPPSVLDQLFRAFHSLKASAGFMKFEKISRLASSAEELLSVVKKGDQAPSGDVIACFAQVKDAVAELLMMVKEKNSDDCDLTDVLLNIESFQQRREAPAAEGNPSAQGSGGSSALISENTVRVNMRKLDSLSDVMGELIVNQSRFDVLEHRIALLNDLKAAELARELKSINVAMTRLVGEMYATIMDIRMVSVGTIFNRFPRVAREISRRKGKDIDLVTSGEETNIDKNILDELSDPLSHLIRNAADHGIELPPQRSAAGKPLQGVISLRAYHENGKVIIEVEDDGQGIDVARVREKAVQNGIYSAEQAAGMSDADMINTIFLPGFSTAREVTEISGRGVGLDVVKTNVERLKGKIRVSSAPGKGTRITMEVPLTMAIVEALMVQVGGELFALPLFAVHSITEVRSSDIHTVQGREVINLHGATIGVKRLSSLMGMGQRGEKKDKIYVVVIEREGAGENERIGFIVDALREKQKVVVKPLDTGVQSTAALSGVTILGDGRVALIIDPAELAALSAR